MDSDDIIDSAVLWLRDYGACDWPEWLLRHQLQIPVTCRQITFQHDNFGRIAGLMLWAFVGDDVHHELSDGKSKILHISEWNEGLNLWLWIASPNQILPSVFRQQLRILVRQYGTCHLYASRSAGMAFRLAQWDSGLRFRSAGPRAATPTAAL